MEIDNFKSDDWIKIWAGSWSFLTCSHFANQYTDEIRFGPMPFIEKSIIFVTNGKSEGWARQSDKDKLGIFLSSEVKNDPDKVHQLCTRFKYEVDGILEFIEKFISAEISESVYKEFWAKILSYYQPHIHVKYVVDYLESSLLEKYLHDLEEVRVYAEPVFTRSEAFMKVFAEQVAQKTGYPWGLILCLTKEEVFLYFKNGVLPDKSILESRNEKAAIVSVGSESLFFIQDDVKFIDSIIHTESAEGIVTGKSAYPGKAQGVVRIVPDPANPGVFNVGDVLVAGMTRPEYLSLMKKASAFVTDAGGVLSHAAIVAREMKKPAVIGTQIATKVLKDCDLVEVDAERGIVTILKRA